jgi:hypothetical protein
VISGVKVAVAVGVAVGGRGVSVGVAVGGKMTSVGVGEGGAATRGKLTGKGRMVKRAYMTIAARATPPNEATSFQGILLLPNSSPQ